MHFSSNYEDNFSQTVSSQRSDSYLAYTEPYLVPNPDYFSSTITKTKTTKTHKQEKLGPTYQDLQRFVWNSSLFPLSQLPTKSCTYSPESTSGFDLGSSPLAQPSLNDDSNFNLYSLWKILGTFLMKICQGMLFCCFVLFACLCVFVSIN
jgi:hypothetical protein